MKLLRMIALALLLPMISHAGVETKKIAEGEGTGFSWSVLQVLSRDEDVNLVVIIQNTGVKWVGAAGIDASFFSLKDSEGKEIKVRSAAGFDGIAYGSTTVGHVLIDGPVSPATKYRLELKAKKDAAIPASFVAKDIRFAAQLKRADNSGDQSQPPEWERGNGGNQPVKASPAGDAKPRYEKIGEEAASPYRELSSAAFKKAMTRDDISCSGATICRDLEMKQIVSLRTIGFMGLYIVAFDEGTPPRVTESYFSDSTRARHYDNFDAFWAREGERFIEELSKDHPSVR